MTAAPSVDDHVQIQQLFALFAHVFDNRELRDLDLVFTKDAVIELTKGAGREFVGLDAIAEFVDSLSPEAPDHHTLDTALFAGADGTVRARSRYLAVLVDGSVHNGDFFDELVRTPEGWRIRRRVSVPRFPLGEQVPVPSERLDAWRPIRG
jgi:hypothetical protein